MNRYTLSRAAAAIVLGLVLGLTPTVVSAQTALTQTTLASAVTDTSGTVWSVASATGITAPGTGATLVLLVVDREIVEVRAVSGTNITVGRGRNSTRAATHISGATVTIAPPGAINAAIPGGQCTRTNLLYVPYIVGGGTGLGSEVGTFYDCLGLTTAGQWVQTNGNGIATLGTTMASVNGVLGAFTGQVLIVSGANAITGFTNPAGVAVGFNIYIIPSGAFTWTAAGNIALAGTAVVNKMLVFTWSGTKWVPSYIA